VARDNQAKYSKTQEENHMLNLLKSAGVFVAMALLLAGCSKSSTSTGGTAPKLAAPTFSGPSSTSSTADTSSGAIYAKSVASLFNATSSTYMGFFAGNGTQSGNTWSWTYTYGGFTATWSATSSSSGYDWKLVYNGVQDNVTFSNWTALSGSETTDGKSGSWTIFYPPTTVAAYQLTWSTGSDGTLTGTIQVNNDTTGSVEYKQVFTNKTDKSGELVVYYGSGPQKEWDIIWNADGSGSYTMWDEQNNAVASGTWS
jgi:hypothetical protein